MFFFLYENEAKTLFKERTFYMQSIEKPEKPYIKRLNYTDMLREFTFYDELNIVKT